MPPRNFNDREFILDTVVVPASLVTYVLVAVVLTLSWTTTGGLFS